MNDNEAYWLAAANPRRRRPVGTARCICGCGQRFHQRHHVIYRQHLRRYGGSMKDERNLVPVAYNCHSAHHNGFKRFRLYMLPDSVFEFAAELMGAGAAYEYLKRHYDGSDMRLELLLAEA